MAPQDKNGQDVHGSYGIYNCLSQMKPGSATKWGSMYRIIQLAGEEFPKEKEVLYEMFGM
jgi:hypothetical protein